MDELFEADGGPDKGLGTEVDVIGGDMFGTELGDIYGPTDFAQAGLKGAGIVGMGMQLGADPAAIGRAAYGGMMSSMFGPGAMVGASLQGIAAGRAQDQARTDFAQAAMGPSQSNATHDEVNSFLAGEIDFESMSPAAQDLLETGFQGVQGIRSSGIGSLAREAGIGLGLMSDPGMMEGTAFDSMSAETAMGVTPGAEALGYGGYSTPGMVTMGDLETSARASQANAQRDKLGTGASIRGRNVTTISGAHPSAMQARATAQLPTLAEWYQQRQAQGLSSEVDPGFGQDRDIGTGAVQDASSPNPADRGYTSPSEFADSNSDTGDFGGPGPTVGGGNPADVSPGYGDTKDGSEGEGEGDDSDGTVLCTALYMQGMLPEDIYRADAAFGKTVGRNWFRAYQIVAHPLAMLMLKSKLVTAIVRPFVSRWAYKMAARMGVK
jgi:hypothetical protein